MAASDLGKNIQENLSKVIIDGKFNNGIVRHALELTNKNTFNTPNPLEVTFKDIKKFDSQNPFIVYLISQIKDSKLADKKIKKYSENASLTKDIELKARLDKLQEFDNINNNEDDSNNFLPPPPLPFPPPPSPQPPSRRDVEEVMPKK